MTKFEVEFWEAEVDLEAVLVKEARRRKDWNRGVIYLEEYAETLRAARHAICHIEDVMARYALGKLTDLENKS